MEFTHVIRSSTPIRPHDSARIFGPDGPLSNRYQPDDSDLDNELTEWVQALWARRVSRLKHSRWNTRWAGIGG